MTQEPKLLPDKLSALTRVALKDLEKIEQDQRYVVDMSEWHWMDKSGECHVCFAGVVMAGTLTSSLYDSLTPVSFDEDTRKKLLALDEMRSGYVQNAVHTLRNVNGVSEDTLSSAYDLDTPLNYADDPEWFKARLYEIADKLEAMGL